MLDLDTVMILPKSFIDPTTWTPFPVQITIKIPSLHWHFPWVMQAALWMIDRHSCCTLNQDGSMLPPQYTNTGTFKFLLQIYQLKIVFPADILRDSPPLDPLLTASHCALSVMQWIRCWFLSIHNSAIIYSMCQISTKLYILIDKKGRLTFILFNPQFGNSSWWKLNDTDLGRGGDLDFHSVVLHLVVDWYQSQLEAHWWFRGGGNRQ